MAKAASPLSLSDDQRRVLEAWRDAPATPRQVALRARIILLAAAGASNRAIARALGTTLVTVLLWRGRFERGGLQALTEIEEGRGPRRRIASWKIRQIVEATRRKKPPQGKRWTVRLMARVQGVSQTMVQRIWDEYDLKPHLTGRIGPTRKVGGPRDIVGLYLNPPDKVLALAFDRVPKRPAERVPEEMAGLIAALEELESRVVGDSRWRRRQEAFRVFLRRIERSVPGGTPIHLVVDRAGTHTQDFVREWLQHRQRFHLHPAPATRTWRDWAAGWLGQVSRKRSPAADLLEHAMADYLAARPAQPCPFAWPGREKQALPIRD